MCDFLACKCMCVCVMVLCVVVEERKKLRIKKVMPFCSESTRLWI
jgi:hypothetical protein